MITVKELISILETLDPNAAVVRPGHSDESGGYDDIYAEDIPNPLTLIEYPIRDWKGKYSISKSKQAGEFKAYCL
jgi:hypothetical protein